MARFAALLLPIAPVAVSMVACMPSSANLQSARTMDKGQTRITPYATATQEYEKDGSTSHVSDNYGVLVGFGGSERSETQLRFEQYRFGGDGETDLLHFFAFGPKFELAENVLAVAVPMGVYFIGNPLATLQFHPGLIATIPAARFLEINAAGKIIIPVGSPEFSWLVVNLGVSLSTDVTRWANVPEVAYTSPAVEGFDAGFLSYGVGVVLYTQSNPAAN